MEAWRAKAAGAALGILGTAVVAAGLAMSLDVALVPDLDATQRRTEYTLAAGFATTLTGAILYAVGIATPAPPGAPQVPSHVGKPGHR